MKEDFRLHILNYFKNGTYSPRIKRVPLIFEKFIVRWNAKKIAAEYISMHRPATNREKREVVIKTYTGSNHVALKIRDYLLTHAETKLVGAYVHGSIATSEEIAYSDFDGLIIVKNECMKNPQMLEELFSALKETERMMLDMDPLQHHGWFVLTEADLNDYPNHYFPDVLLDHAATLMGRTRLVLQQGEAEQSSFRSSFLKLAQSITTKLDAGSYLQNYYAFKNLMSEFMLLPAIYIQAKTGKGVFKKYSFEIVERELGESYAVMKKISDLRQQWNYQSPAGYLEHRKRKRLTDTYASDSGQLPAPLRQEFESELAASMKEFVNRLQKRLQE
jgi:hypothetical protein